MEPARASTTDDQRRAASLYSVLVLLLAAVMLVAIQAIGRGRAARGEAVKGRVVVPVPFGEEPLAGLPAADLARVASGIRLVTRLHFRTPDVFPCTECHDPEDDDLERRELTLDHKTLRLEHGSSMRWCFDCHAPLARDALHLADGTALPFEQSSELCGQCHGRIYRDWEAGVHGLRTGYWDGAKRDVCCVHCHDPHTPKVRPIAPLPPPVRPGPLNGGGE